MPINTSFLPTIFHEVIEEIDLSSNYTSPAYDFTYIFLVSYMFFWSQGSGLSGTVTIQSIDEDPTPNNPQWRTLNTHNIATNSGSLYITSSSQFPRYIRFVWTRTAGTGSLNLHIRTQRKPTIVVSNAEDIKIFDNINITQAYTSPIYDVSEFNVSNGMVKWPGATVSGTFGNLIVQQSNYEDPARFVTTATTGIITFSTFSQAVNANITGKYIRFQWSPLAGATSGTINLRLLFRYFGT